MLEPWKHLAPVEQMAAYECVYLLPGNNLLKGERMGALWSTENRSPMMDHRVSELFIRLPAEQKFQQGITKYYLKNYAATKLSHDLIFKKKTMPTLPIGEWMKTTLREWTRDAFSRIDNAYVNKAAAMAMLDEHIAGTHNHTRSLRTILMSQLWLENCVNAATRLKAA